MRGRFALLCLVLAAAVAACSDDGGGADAQAYVDALAAELADEESGLDEEAADCVAEASIDAIGADNLEDAGITPEDVAAADGPQDLDVDLSEEQARAAARSFIDCDIPFGEAFVGEDGPEEGIACIDENLDEDTVVDAYAAQYLGDQEESDRLFGELFTGLQEECGEFLGG
jgi:non-ribosomal peptide synthetase component F